MLILGINSAYHESSACILKNGKLLGAAEEERFNRQKHGKQARPESADQLPWNSIEFLLGKLNIALNDIDIVAFSFDPEKRKEVVWPKEYYRSCDWGSGDAEKRCVIT
ncbi:MAG: hypothetical protein HQK54_07060 [Oligoflexales bacterium]|nr:hypothetical protein [Oligoflexales bacterium]